MSRIIIDVIGMAGSGKSRLCEYICREYGFELYRPSDALREYARVHGKTLASRQDYIDCHHELIADDPLAIIAPVINSDSERICLDGMRAPLPFLELREQFDAKLIYLDCPAEVRLARIQADETRSGHRLAMTLDALLADEAPDLENPDRNLPNMIEMQKLADYTIDASAPLEKVLAETRKIIEGLVHAKD